MCRKIRMLQSVEAYFHLTVTDGMLIGWLGQLVITYVRLLLVYASYISFGKLDGMK